MIDTHTHLDQAEFDIDRTAVLQRARDAGVEVVICVGTSLTSSEAALRLAAEHAWIHAAVGIQPNQVADAGKDAWDRVAEMAGMPDVIAVGETGLDRHWDFTPFERQQDYFDRHLQLAQKHQLPAIIHCRDAESDLMPMLREATKMAPLMGVLHSFSGSAPFAAECLALGLFVSFSGMVSYTNKKFRPLRDLARTIPENRLLIETDSPYLVPHPLRGTVQRNEPSHLRYVAQSLADLRQVSLAELIAVTSANARTLFSIG